ncbi:hypothetical protein LZ30DRAFT_753267 [Colletotrichum cereale]|nr:hypothetical protein LZ30DRAFT_753267 [Colletotrichum cereale]
MASNIEEKYSQERSKRLRPDGNKQYMTVRSPDVQSLAKDPWVDYKSLASQEQPLKDGGSIKFLIIGAGHNGILFAARLIDAGFNPKDIVLVDIAGGYGGNWYWNRYPGLMCDVEGYCYLPLLEETGYMPKHKYSFGAEIRGQSERSAAHYGSQAMFCTKVNKQVWDETRGRWVVNMTQSLGHVREPTNLTVDAQFVLLASGLLAIPKVPKAPGFGDFRSRHEVFHTSRWDYNITGGSQQQPDLVNLRNKRVAIIGTGATAVQAIPHLAQWAKHLYVIQRTPSYCGERAQKETTSEDWAKIADGPGWQERRRNNLNSYLSADPEPVDLVNDGWSENQARAGLIGSNSKLLALGPGAEHVRRLLEIDTPIAEELRARVDRIVRDTSTAEKLKPWYAGWCKRPTFNDDYLQTFNRDNVTLIDTDGKGIDGYTARGIVVANQELDVDVLVLATGFILSSSLPPSSQQDAPIIGSGGRDIDDKWSSPDFGTLFGVASHGFPNFFANFKKGAGSSYNITSAFEEMARLVAYIVHEAEKQSRNPSSVVINAEDKWGDEVAKRAGWFSALATCTPSYFTNEGQTSAQLPITQYNRDTRQYTYFNNYKLEWQGRCVEPLRPLYRIPEPSPPTRSLPPEDGSCYGNYSR